MRRHAAIIVLLAMSAHAAPAAVPDRSGDALDAGLLDENPDLYLWLASDSYLAME